MEDKYYMELALKEAIRAAKLDEVPIGCLIVKDNKIIASSYNRKNLNNIGLKKT